MSQQECLGSKRSTTQCNHMIDPEDIVIVPNIDTMDNETFLKHMDKRHADQILNGPLSDSPYIVDGWVGPYRAFHENLHNIAHPGQYDHEHLW